MANSLIDRLDDQAKRYQNVSLTLDEWRTVRRAIIEHLPRMCRDGHEEIRHANSENCPLCVALADTVELDFLLNEGGTYEQQLAKAEERAKDGDAAVKALSDLLDIGIINPVGLPALDAAINAARKVVSK